MVEKGFVLNLRPGEIVEVCTESEVLSTLDEKGTLEGLPFTHEMRRYCGHRFEVLKSVKKMIVEVPGVGLRRIRNTVILKGSECNGQAHGACQRTCLLLWKEAWLKRVREAKREQSPFKDVLSPTKPPNPEDETFSCQSTNLLSATSRLPIWDIRQYVWDISSASYKPVERLRGLLTALNFKIQELLAGDKYSEWWRVRGKLRRTPSATLNLRPGELVQVKNKEEILETLDFKGKNRGLEFTRGMLKYCGGKYRVLKRVDKMINEGTGKMRQIANTVLLEGVTCDGKHAGGCQRTCYCLWREIWLKRVEAD
jgi:hypothetical protein